MPPKTRNQVKYVDDRKRGGLLAVPAHMTKSAKARLGIYGDFRRASKRHKHNRKKGLGGRRKKEEEALKEEEKDYRANMASILEEEAHKLNQASTWQIMQITRNVELIQLVEFGLHYTTVWQCFIARATSHYN
jgi:hypothetical protein